MSKLKNVSQLDLSDVSNPFANVDGKPVYDRKLDTLERERYERACKAGNWGVMFDYENNEL